MKKFNQSKYIQNYKKEKYKRIYIDIDKDLGAKFDETLKKKKQTRSDILLPAIENFIKENEEVF